MKAAQKSTRSVLDTDELGTEINYERNMDYLRGVKRLCFSLADDVAPERGHSFLETKWELEVTKKRRELPAFINSLSVVGRIPNFLSTGKISAYHHRDIDLTSVTATIEDKQPTRSDELPPTVNENAEKDTTTPAAVRELTPKQESKLVRSALRSSLDAEDTALLNDFLSKAQAKRAAKAAEATQDGEDGPFPELLEPSCHTPPREPLTDLDTNSPSPTKTQFSPCKANDPESVRVLPDSANNDEETDRDQPPSSPANRRSIRTRQQIQPPTPIPRVIPPAIRNTGLRRAKGTEFIFRDRTEEEKIEKETRENTAYNKGEMRVKAMLRDMAKQKTKKRLLAQESSEDEPPEREQCRNKHEKFVTWRKERFIEYEDGGYEDFYIDDSSTSGDGFTSSDCESPRVVRSARIRQLKESQSNKGSQIILNPRLRRAQREAQLNRLKVQPDEFFSSTSSISPFSPSNVRKKLTPKPRKTLLAAPVSKNAATNKSTSKDNDRTTATKKTTLTIDAGFTPKPKRTRSRT